MKHSTPIAGLALVGAAALLLTGCAGGPSESAPTTASGAANEPTPRIAVTYDGGIAVLDADTLEQVGDLPIEGFTRVNPAGDGRHVFVTVPAGFQLLDTGAWTADGKSYAEAPVLGDVVWKGEKAGHVVVHGDKTVLFADGTGDFSSFDTAALLTSGGKLPATQDFTSEAAHHGVAIELTSGEVISTLGDEEGRTGARVLDAAGAETARFEQCPAIHGEAAAADEVVVFGCQDGAITYKDGQFTKITAPDPFGRIGNIFTTDDSAIALGDYRDDQDAEGYLLQSFVVIDTAANTMKKVDLPDGVGYTFRDLGRGANGEFVILGTDGALHIFDETGASLATHPVIGAWEGPAEWQDPHPALKIQNGVAYVSEPSANELHAVDLRTGEITATATLPGTPNELAVVTG